MIKPNELRIGNLIKSDTGLLSSSEFEFLTVLSIKKDLLFFEEVQMIGELPKDCAGIPLTEEWLLRFGFKHHKPNYWSKCEDFRFVLNHQGLHCSMGDEESGILFNLIHYVHDLQNTWFALTGEELTIE